mgnify:CR=1 FL=1
MADPPAATITQLRHIQARTGRSIAGLHAVLAASGVAKTGERCSLMMAGFQPGYGDANAVALCCNKPVPPLDGGPAPAAAAPAGDPLDALSTGPKAALRRLHDAVLALVQGFGSFEQAPKKTCFSLRRKKHFAMVGPATRTEVEIGLNARALPAHPRLRMVPPGDMCTHPVRLRQPAEVDPDLAAWLRTAFDAAG